MKRLFVGLAVLLLLLVSPVFAGTLDVKVEGTTVGGSFANSIDFTGNVSGSGAGSTKTIDVGGSVEKITLGFETVVAGDNGTVFLSGDTGTTFTLPAAATGLTFTFVEGSTTNASTVNAAGADTFINYGTDAATATLTSTAGDDADSVSISGASGGWYVIDMASNVWTGTE